MVAKTVFFDFDGTLIDTVHSVYAEYLRVASKQGLKPPGRDDFTKLVGLTWSELINELWDSADVKAFIEEYDPKNESSELFPKELESLKQIKSSHDLSILTSRGQETMYWHMQRAGIDPSLFAHIYTRETTPFHKPDPRVLTWAAEEVGQQVGETVYIGDGLVDARCTLGAGAKFIGVLSGGVKRPWFEDLGVNYIVDDISGVPQILDDI